MTQPQRRDTDDAAGPEAGELESFLPLMINRISESISKSFGKAIEAYDLRLVDCRVMRAVDRMQTARLAELSGAAGVDLSTLCRLVRRLADKDILAMTFRGPTSRADMVTLTPKGQRLLIELQALARRHEASLLDGLDPEEVEICIRALRKIFGNVGDEWRREG